MNVTAAPVGTDLLLHSSHRLHLAELNALTPDLLEHLADLLRERMHTHAHDHRLRIVDDSVRVELDLRVYCRAEQT